jgi:hypothetical protein
MKRLLTYSLPLTLSACINFSDIEKQALADRAIMDARSQPKSVHLAYLHCYALQEVDKNICQRAIREKIDGVKTASSWEYILPFDYEAERLGFATFLRDRGKICKSLNEGPQYKRSIQGYDVKCSDGHNYTMSFDSENLQWQITK